MSRRGGRRGFRHGCVLAHRYAGLVLAGFLTIAGLTGTLLAFKVEIDKWLNPDLYRVAHRESPLLDPFTLRERALALAPGSRIDDVRLYREPDAPYVVVPAYEGDGHSGSGQGVGGERLVIDPYTGDLIRRVPTAIWPLSRETFVEFVDLLHYTLLLGDAGIWIFGVVALVWTLDSVVGFYLTLPAHTLIGARAKSGRSWWRRWGASWLLKRRPSPYRRYFDWHRAGGLWLWPLLLIFAWSSVYFNLGEHVYLPVMKQAFAFDDIYGSLPDAAEERSEPLFDWRKAHKVAQRLMAEHGARIGLKVLREDSLSYDAGKNVFLFTVLSDRDVAAKYAGTNVIFDATNGKFIAIQAQTGKAAGNTITAWLVAIHVAGFGGIPLQVFVAAMGLLVSMLSATGVYLWLRKRSAKHKVPRR